MKVPPREPLAGPSSGSPWRRLALWLGLLAVLAGGAGYVSWRRTTDRRATEAVLRALDRGDVDAAKAGLAAIDRARPDSAEVEYLKARLDWARRDAPATLDHLRKARTLGHPEPTLNRLVGLIHLNAGQPEKAEPLLLQAWENEPGLDPDVADGLCRIFFESFRVGAALAVVDRWERAAPDDVRPRIWRAEVHSRKDPGPEIQVKDYDAILARKPDHMLSYLGRANALGRLGRFDAAKGDYDRYLAARPDDPEGLAPAAKLALDRDEEDEALALYDRLLAIQPENAEGLLGRATILLKERDAAGALGLLDRVIALTPKDPEPRYRRGQALDRLGRGDEAKAEFAEQKRLQAEREEIETIRKSLMRDPENVTLRADAASWFFAHGYADQGVEWAQKALQIRPEHAPSLALLADHYEKAGNPGLARFYRSQIVGRGAAP